MFSRKFLMYLGIAIGSGLGSFVPLLWGGETISGWGLLFSAVGAAIGLYAGFKIGTMIEE